MRFSTLFFATTALAIPLLRRDEGTTAAATFGWNDPSHEDQFDGTTLSKDWGIYDGPGHAGNGRRSPSAISLSNSILTISGTADGTTGGIAWNIGQQYGRWETRARYTAGTAAYHQVLLLWPDKEDWPVGGEVDYSEVSDAERKHLQFFLHYGKDNQQVEGDADIDMTQWHNYAVEWTADHVVGYVDGKEFFRSEKKETLPPRAMHATIQLDWFPGKDPEGTGKMEVDWIRQYTI